MKRATRTLGSRPAGGRGHRQHRRDDRRRRDARGHQPPALPAAHHRRGPVAERRPRASSGSGPSTAPKKRAEAASQRAGGREAARQHHRPDLRHLQHALRPRRNPPAGRGHRRATSTWSSRSARTSRTSRSSSNADVNVCMYREFGRLLCEELDRPYLQAPIGLHSHHEVPAHARRARSGSTPSRSSSARSTPRSSRSGTCGARSRQDFFGTASFAIVANETYARGVRHFLEDGDGPALHLRLRAQAGREARQRGGPQGGREKPPLVLFGSLQRADVPRRAGGRGDLHPGVVPRRHHPPAHRHAVHGLCRRDLSRPGILQRAVRRAVPHPAARRPTWTGSSRRRRGCTRSCPWDEEAQGAARRAASRRSPFWSGSRPPSACATAPSAEARKAQAKPGSPPHAWRACARRAWPRRRSHEATGSRIAELDGRQQVRSREVS